MKTAELYNKAAAYCSVAERCKQDVMEKLAALAPENTDGIEEIVQKLEAEGFLNEERYARAFAGDKLRFQGWGRMKIRAALQAKKVPATAIAAALNELDEATYREKLRQLRERKLRELRGEKDAFVKRQKVSRFLLGRGFTLDEIVAEEGIEPTTFRL